MAAKKTGKPGSANSDKQKSAKKSSVKKSPAKADKDKAASTSVGVAEELVAWTQ